MSGGSLPVPTPPTTPKPPPNIPLDQPLAISVQHNVVVNQRVTVSELYGYPLGSNPTLDFLYSKGEPRGHSKKGEEVTVSFLMDANGDLVSCKVKALKFALKWTYQHLTSYFEPNLGSEQRHSASACFSHLRRLPENVFQKTAAFIAALRKQVSDGASLEKAKALHFKEVSAAQDLVASRVGSNIPLVYTNVSVIESTLQQKAMRNRACYTRHGIVSVIHRVEHCVLEHRARDCLRRVADPGAWHTERDAALRVPAGVGDGGHRNSADPGRGLGLGGPLDSDSVSTATAIMKAGRRRPCEDNTNDGRVARAACACSEWKTGVAVGCRQQQQQRRCHLAVQSVAGQLGECVCGQAPGETDEGVVQGGERAPSTGRDTAGAGRRGLEQHGGGEGLGMGLGMQVFRSARRYHRRLRIRELRRHSRQRSACEKLRMHCMDSDVAHLRNVAQHGAETPPVRLEAVRLVCLLRILVLHLQYHEHLFLRVKDSGKCRARTAGSIAGNPDFKPSCSFGSEATGPWCLCDASRQRRVEFWRTSARIVTGNGT
ncbi:hypothetical protein B0H17DRAFT_1129538 [Mycena rosella]|uniref:Uncharacterized protein n=1 Tax=Mycena rosella TaxID=1033263 RepID=A0AAD7DU35_MYCRO|nr:hypothetical protein B0H17DRAFT_1129538 [Mycena rosella]